MLVTCPCCQGAKKVMGLGCLQRDCAWCSGVGALQQSESQRIKDEAAKRVLDIASEYAQSEMVEGISTCLSDAQIAESEKSVRKRGRQKQAD